MPRFSLTQLLMATALVAILLAIGQSNGRVYFEAYIECLCFSSDGSDLVVAKVNGPTSTRRAREDSGKLARTVGMLRASDGEVISVLDRKIIDAERDDWTALAQFGRNSIASIPAKRSVAICEFEGGEVSIHSLDGIKSQIPLSIGTPAYGVMPSHDGNYLAVCSHYFVGVSGLKRQFEVQMTRVNSGSLEWYPDSLEIAYGAAPVSFSDDGLLLAIGGKKYVAVKEIATTNEVFRIRAGFASHAAPVQFVPNRSLLAIGKFRGIDFYDIQGKKVESISLFGPCRMLTCSLDGSLLAAIHDEGATLLDVDSRQSTREWKLRRPLSLALSPDGTRLAIGDAQGLVTLFDTKSGNQLWQVSPPSAENLTWAVPCWMLGAWLIACIGLAWRKTRVKLTTPSEPSLRA